MTHDHQRRTLATPEIILRDMRRDDLAAVAGAHIASFEGYFLTSLGSGFIQRLYAEYCASSEVALVAERNGQIVGFLLGTQDLAAVYRRFYRRQTVFIARTIAVGVVRNPRIRSAMYARKGHLRIAVRSILGRPAPMKPVEPDELPGAELVSIGVMPSAQGSAAATLLVAGLLDALRLRDAKACNLSVQTMNARAIRFYERLGWTRTGISGDEYRYRFEL